MTKHIERLMSRASVAAMAAFAPKPDPASTIPQFAERVDEPAPGGDRSGGDTAIDGLTAEEQAQLDAMQQGGAADGGNVDHSGDEPGAGDPPADGAAAAADGDDDDDPADGAAPDGATAPRQPPRTISYGRHQKELAKLQKERDDLQASLDGSKRETVAEREQRTRLDERTRMLLEAINTKQPPAAAAPAADTDPEPNKDEDPIAHLEWRNRKLERTVSDMQGGQQRQQETTAAEREEQQIFNALAADIQGVIAGDPIRGIAADPTMADAFVHLRETRYTELGHIFANIDINDPAQCATLSQDDQAKLKTQIEQTFHNEQMLVARQSLQARRSPAAVIRSLAKARGWKPAEAAAAPVAGAPPPARNGNGAAPPAPRTAAPAAAGSVKDQLSQVRDNLEASRSLSDAGGSPGGAITPQQLADMPPEEFERYYAALKDSGQLDKMMGKVPM